MQPQICIRLTDNQKQDIINAIQNKTPLSLILMARQIDVNGDTMNVSKKQAKDIYKALTKNEAVRLQFNKAQVQKMKDQIGNGILDSMASFFKSIPSSANRVYNAVKRNVLPKSYTNPYGSNQPYNDYGTSSMMVSDRGTRVNYNIPKQQTNSTFDKVANSVQSFDKSISNFFGYGIGYIH